MARAALLHLLRHRTAAVAAEPLPAFRCLMSSGYSRTPAAGIKWAGFCRHFRFSSRAAVNDVIGNDLANTDSSLAFMEGKERLDPFSIVADELSLIATRLRSMVAAEVPNLASAAEYFFKIGAEGKRFRPTVLLLMATALNVRIPELPPAGVGDNLPTDLRTRQQRIAEITEMIHVASLLHDDVLDDADTRRGVGSLNAVMGNKLAVLAGDFLLSRACLTLASLKNTEVVTLIATVVENLVTGETMQLTTASTKRFSMEYYMQKTYNKTASLMSNSCKSVAILAGHSAEVAKLAFEYGKNLGLAFQLIDDVLDFTGTSASLGKGSLSDIRHGIITAPILFAMEEFPQLRAVVDKGFDNPANVDIALEYLGKSRGIERTKELAMKHANQAAAAIDSLPQSDDEDVMKSRLALVDLTQRVITRNK
ncbi:solanesyl-diphosphate synthase 1, mitochondrial-like isoform X1 [Hibiscus syriacus]|uniref:solanesyl-diphosphate synthase 1, mitochondrial-like isoform X1 n=1 Tax=Hibiscus syriacus TaxID=106335 RepID=UPI001924D59C|nr:solanesyl-diphosphate synthase 1, mitochondrial-like isoform X1 [Hibiscus syriacus]